MLKDKIYNIGYFIQDNIINPILCKIGYVPEYREVSDYGMERYPDVGVLDDYYVNITTISVPTERDKTELLKAFRYFHDNPLIDTGYCAVNSIAHIYLNPELIEVRTL